MNDSSFEESFCSRTSCSDMNDTFDKTLEFSEDTETSTIDIPEDMRIPILAFPRSTIENILSKVSTKSALQLKMASKQTAAFIQQIAHHEIYDSGLELHISGSALLSDKCLGFQLHAPETTSRSRKMNADQFRRIIGSAALRSVSVDVAHQYAEELLEFCSSTDLKIYDLSLIHVRKDAAKEIIEMLKPKVLEISEEFSKSDFIKALPEFILDLHINGTRPLQPDIDIFRFRELRMEAKLENHQVLYILSDFISGANRYDKLKTFSFRPRDQLGFQSLGTMLASATSISSWSSSCTVTSNEISSDYIVCRNDGYCGIFTIRMSSQYGYHITLEFRSPKDFKEILIMYAERCCRNFPVDLSHYLNNGLEMKDFLLLHENYCVCHNDSCFSVCKKLNR